MGKSKIVFFGNHLFARINLETVAPVRITAQPYTRIILLNSNNSDVENEKKRGVAIAKK